ncbi:MAG: phage holin family protein [Verrucomicrobiota bacterium]
MAPTQNDRENTEPLPPTTSTGTLVRSFLESILAYVQARSQLLKLESKEASAAITLKVFLFLSATTCLTLAYALAIVAAISLVSQATTYPWQYVSLAAAGLHVLVAVILILVAKAPFRRGLFRHTLNEIEKDRQWLNPKHHSKSPDPGQKPK